MNTQPNSNNLKQCGTLPMKAMEVKSNKRVRLEKRNTEIRDFYSEKFKGGLRHEVIIAELEEKFHLAPLTLEYIVFRRSGYEEY